ncbi:sporulation-specific diadenylate cyclase CdaS [Brevibacillus sp. H7]|jgi:diadenylate cyclase|uniref:sporulation-specific diadenylate cyclase CdaS n=1 Tax=Brevibacillus sp. H7 TaxID=3349138 RepID=UPI0038209EA8
MPYTNCDFSPMKERVRVELKHISAAIEQCLNVLNNENDCLLDKLEQIKDHFLGMQAAAASYYLHCYLAPYTSKYAEIAISIQHLSERRHGGLMIIERNDPVEPLVQPGIPIGAALTHSLLESIFHPGSPLHDGAVLIRANTIISAGNILPLSRNIFGEKKLGTRHRSAIGLSEQCDALVLVVSEETGRVSFALNGELYPVST